MKRACILFIALLLAIAGTSLNCSAPPSEPPTEHDENYAVGTSGMAITMRLMRANLLDELNKPYVTTARAKGVPPLKLILKYPVRIAINPFISTIGLLLPALISGEAIVSVVLNLPTTGPLLLNALRSQDMYLAGSFLMFLAVLIVIGVLISDFALAILDPRIRLQGGRER